jgi:hypothetical protein
MYLFMIFIFTFNKFKFKACSLVVKYLNKVVQSTEKCGIKDCVDGGNLYVILAELGEHLYSTVLAHILSFGFNLAGAMLLLCDINGYK